MTNLLRTIFCLLLVVSCTPDDDESTGGPIFGGPTDLPTGGGEGVGNGNGSDGILTYDATQDLKDLVDFPIGNIVSAALLSSTSATNRL